MGVQRVFRKLRHPYFIRPRRVAGWDRPNRSGLMDQIMVYLAAAAFTLAVALGRVWSKEQRRKAADESEKQLWQEERHDERPDE